MDDVIISGLHAKTAVIQGDGWPTLQWFFIEHNRKLVYLSIHDPVTLQSLNETIDSITFMSSMNQSARLVLPNRDSLVLVGM